MESPKNEQLVSIGFHLSAPSTWFQGDKKLVFIEKVSLETAYSDSPVSREHLKKYQTQVDDSIEKIKAFGKAITKFMDHQKSKKLISLSPFLLICCIFKKFKYNFRYFYVIHLFTTNQLSIPIKHSLPSKN